MGARTSIGLVRLAGAFLAIATIASLRGEAPTACADEPASDTIDVDGSFAAYRMGWERAAGRAAMLEMKLKNSLFDLRLLPGDETRFAPEMAAERAEILAGAELYGVGFRAASAQQAAEAALDEGFMATLQKSLAEGEAIASAGIVKPLTEVIAAEATKKKGQFLEALAGNNRNLFESREAMARASDEHAAATRMIGMVETAIAAGERDNAPDLAAMRVRLADAKRRSADTAQRLSDVSRAHVTQMIVRCDLKRAIAAHDTIEKKLQDFESVAKAIGTASGTVKAINERDGLELLKTCAELMSGVNEWSVQRLGKDEEAAEKAIKNGMGNYRLLTSWRSPTQINAGVQSSILGGVVAATRDKEVASEAKKAAEALGAGLKVVTTALPYLIQLRDALKPLRGEKGMAAVEADAKKDADAWAEAMRTRADLADVVPARALNAMTWFKAAAAGVKQIASQPWAASHAKILEIAAADLEVAASSPEAFARITKLQWQQGGRLTPSFDFEGAYSDRLSLHPALVKFRVRVPPEHDQDVIVQRGSLTATLTKAEFDRVLVALTTLTSLTGANPTEDQLYDLAQSKETWIDVLTLGEGGLTVDRKKFGLDELTDRHSRAVLEADAGAVAREIAFLNDALDFSGERFARSGLQELAARRRLSEIALHHRALDEAWRIAYGGEIPSSVFGGIRASSAGGPRTADNVSPLEKRILAARNRLVNSGPVHVAWVDVKQGVGGSVEIAAGLEVGDLPSGARLTRRARILYRDGSSVAAALRAPRPEESPFVAHFVAEKLDWAKLEPDAVVKVEVEAEAGGGSDRATRSVPLDVPVVFEDLGSFPQVATPGAPLRLVAGASLSSEMHGVAGTPDVTFLVRVGKAGPVAVKAESVDIYNDVGLAASAQYIVPAEAAKEAEVELTAVVRWGPVEVRRTLAPAPAGGAAKDLVYRGHTGPVIALAVSGNGERLATASLDRTVRIWDLRTARELRKLDTPELASASLSFSPDGKLLAFAQGFKRGVVVWTLPPGLDGDIAPRALGEPTSFANVVRYSPDGRWLAVGVDEILTGMAGRRGTVQLWDVGAGRIARTLSAGNGGVAALAFTADSQRLAAAVNTQAGDPLSAMIWQVTGDTPAVVCAVGEGGWGRAEALAFVEQDTRLLAMHTDSGICSVYDATSGRRLDTFVGPKRPVAANPRGTLLAAGVGTWTMAIASPADGKVVQGVRFLHPAGLASDVAWTPKGDGVVVSYYDNEPRFHVVDPMDTDVRKRVHARLRFRNAQYRAVWRDVGPEPDDETLSAVGIGGEAMQEDKELPASGRFEALPADFTSWRLGVDYAFPAELDVVQRPDGVPVARQEVSLRARASDTAQGRRHSLWIFYLTYHTTGPKSGYAMLARDPAASGGAPLAEAAWKGPWACDWNPRYPIRRRSDGPRGRGIHSPEILGSLGGTSETGPQLVNIGCHIYDNGGSPGVSCDVFLWATYEVVAGEAAPSQPGVAGGGQPERPAAGLEKAPTPKAAAGAGPTIPLEPATPKPPVPPAGPSTPKAGEVDKAGATKALKRGIDCADDEDWKGAETAYREAVRLDPTADDAWSALAEACCAQKHLEDAVTAMREAVRLRPKEADYHVELAEYLKLAGHDDEAKREAEEAARLDRESKRDGK